MLVLGNKNKQGMSMFKNLVCEYMFVFRRVCVWGGDNSFSVRWQHQTLYHSVDSIYQAYDLGAWDSISTR